MASTFDAVTGNSLRLRLNVPDLHEDTLAEVERVRKVVARQLSFFQRGVKDDVETHEFLFVDIDKQITHRTLRFVVRSSVESRLHKDGASYFSFTFVSAGTDPLQSLMLLSLDHANEAGEPISRREYNASRLRPVDIKDFAATTGYLRLAGLCVRCLEDWSDGEGEGEVTQWLREDRPGISVSLFTVVFDNETFDVEVKKVWGGVPQIVNVARSIEM